MDETAYDTMLWHPRVKFEDERPVQQAARMLGLQIEASF
jgi:hypothetical protein